MKTKRIENAVGWRLGIFAFVGFWGQILVARIIKSIDSAWYQEQVNNLSLFLPIIMLDLLAFPIFCLLMKKLPKTEQGNEKLSVGKFISGIPVMSFFVIAGGLIGSFVQSKFTASSTAGLEDILSGSSFFLRVLYVGILAPVVEEIVFRKMLIDRLSAKGKWFAILVSALCFGLYHGNFSQFFYAFFLGTVWGIIYVRTGNIFYSMGYHFIINMSTSTIGVLLMNMADANVPGSDLPFNVYAAFRVMLAIIGLILVIVNFGKIFSVEDENGVKGGKLLLNMFTSWGLWVHYALCILIFVLTIAGSNSKETVTDLSMTMVINVKDGIVDTSEQKIPITIYEDGEYTFFFDWYDNEDPAFITGVCVEDSEGKSVLWTTGGRLSAEMNPTFLSAGDYSVVFSYLESEEAFKSYCLDKPEYTDSNEVPSCDYEMFGVDGKYSVDYSFKITKVK